MSSPFYPRAKYAVTTDVVPHTVVSQVVLPEIVGDFLRGSQLRLSDAEAAASSVTVSIEPGTTPEHLAALTAHGDRVETLHIVTTGFPYCDFIEVHGAHLSSVVISAYMFFQCADTDVKLVAANCPQLRSLRIHDCMVLSDAAVIHIATKCPQLEYLNVGGCCYLTDAAIITVATCCPQLQSLNVEHCKNVSDAAVIAVASSCPQLELLGLGSCPKLSNAAIVAVASGCSQLRWLDVSYCVKLSDDAVIAINSNCPQMASFGIRGCRRMTSAVGYNPDYDLL